jgi:hypothetical protein
VRRLWYSTVSGVGGEGEVRLAHVNQSIIVGKVGRFRIESMRRHLRRPSAARVSLVLAVGASRCISSAGPIPSTTARGGEGKVSRVRHTMYSTTYIQYVVYCMYSTGPPQRRRVGRTNRGEGPKAATKSPRYAAGRVRGGDDSEVSKVGAAGGPHLTVGTDGGMGRGLLVLFVVRGKLVRMYRRSSHSTPPIAWSRERIRKGSGLRINYLERERDY